MWNVEEENKDDEEKQFSFVQVSLESQICKYSPTRRGREKPERAEEDVNKFHHSGDYSTIRSEFN